MNSYRFFAPTLLSMAVLAGCSTQPASNAALERARSDYQAVQNSPQAGNLAGGEMKQANDALNKANEAWMKGEEPAQVDHLVHLAKQRVGIAQEAVNQKAAEAIIANADAARATVRLDARTEEADKAHQSAESARKETDIAQERTRQLEAQLSELNAKQTPRGLVITIGDVLFDTNKSQLKSGGMRNIEKLAAFLREYPQRKVRIEGFTDSTGSDSYNEELSNRRADAVLTALLDMGVERDRVSARGYGEAYPVAGNDSAGGRQMNRRVEIILSDDSGNIAPR